MGLHNSVGIHIGDDYSIEAFCRATADLVADALSYLSTVEYDTMVVTGISGAVYGARVAERLDKNLMIIRKPSDVHHSDYDAEGYLGKRWIFVDDFVSAGVTANRVLGFMAERHPRAEFVGIFEYAVYGEGRWTSLDKFLDMEAMLDEHGGYQSISSFLRQQRRDRRSAVRPLSEEEQVILNESMKWIAHPVTGLAIPQKIMMGTEE